MSIFGVITVEHTVKKKRKEIQVDEKLLNDIAKGNRKAFEILYHNTDKAVYGFVLSILKNHQDAEDVMHDTYIKIRETAHLYTPQGKPLAWIFTIAKNVALTKLRRQKKESFLNYDDMENDIDFSTCSNFEDKLVIENVFRILSNEERQIIMLHAVAGLKHREIASILELPLSTILSKYARSLRKLKENLEKE